MDRQILSTRGKPKFSSDGFIYVFDALSKNDDEIRFWRCERRGTCKARIHTKNGEIIKKVNLHSHDASAVDVEVAQIVTAIKRRAEDTMEGTIQVIFNLF